jgi:hypothetical protein
VVELSIVMKDKVSKGEDVKGIEFSFLNFRPRVYLLSQL